MSFERKLAIIGSIASILGIFLWFYDHEESKQIKASETLEVTDNFNSDEESNELIIAKENEKTTKNKSFVSNRNVPQEEQDISLSVKSIIFENKGLKNEMRVEMKVINGKVSGNLITIWDYDENLKEIYPFKSRTLYKSPSGGMRIEFDGLDVPYNLPSWQSDEYIIWNIKEDSSGEDYLIIPTHGKNYETMEFVDYDMVLQQANI